MTPEEETQEDARAFTERWIAKGLDVTPLTEADRQQVVDGIRRIYRSQRVPWPDHVVWVRSPFELGIESESSKSLITRWRNDPARRRIRAKIRRWRIIRAVRSSLRRSITALLRIVLYTAWTVAFLAFGASVLLVLGSFVTFVVWIVRYQGFGAGPEITIGHAIRLWLAFLGGSGATLAVFMAFMLVMDDDMNLKVLPRSNTRSKSHHDRVFEPEDLENREIPVRGHINQAASQIDSSVASAIAEVWNAVWDGRTSSGGRFDGVMENFTLTRSLKIDGWLGRTWRMEYRPSTLADRDRDLMEGLAMAHRAAGWTAYGALTLICEPPLELHTERVGDRYRLHNDNGPAVVWAGAPYYNGYFVHGHLIPERLYGEDVSIQDLHAERDEAFRRVAIERMGWLRYVQKADLRLVATTPDPADDQVEHRLYDLPKGHPKPDRVLVTVRGAGRPHSSGGTVPADVNDPIGALAWLYGISAADYGRFASSVRGDLLLPDADVLRVEVSESSPWLEVPTNGVELRNYRTMMASWRLLPGDDSPGVRWVSSSPSTDDRLLGHLYVPPGQSAYLMQGDEPAGSAIVPGGYAVRQRERFRIP